ncbi:type II toxin-antitoxin system PemK/MazF family toxin [Kitasatospora sp. NPDC056783]|uniref:type II toxin-antitoxin system PemK/MazF family toxin n=1 Tax=Kitasatospora sp. NPDC056783 TaxID=3345943 RepID=UPI0036864B50
MNGMTATWLVLSLLGVVSAAAAVAALLRRARRAGRPAARPTGPAGPWPSAGAGPRPREIWWAEVPFEDGPGSKDRPCLVLRVRGRTATVAKITSRHHAERPGVLALPPGSVGDRRGRAGWLETDELREVPLSAFRRRAGTVDRRVWSRAERVLQGR